MNKKWFIFISVIAFLLVVFGTITLIKSKNEAPKPRSEPQPQATPGAIDITAQFEIYTNNTKRIFTDSKYHNRSPEVYIEISNPSLIHIKKTSISWGNFFDTLPMKLTDNCLTTGTGQVFCTNETGQLKFYINSIEQPNALNQVINQNDKLIVRYTSN